MAVSVIRPYECIITLYRKYIENVIEMFLSVFVCECVNMFVCTLCTDARLCHILFVLIYDD